MIKAAWLAVLTLAVIVGTVSCAHEQPTTPAAVDAQTVAEEQRDPSVDVYLGPLPGEQILIHTLDRAPIVCNVMEVTETHIRCQNVTVSLDDVQDIEREYIDPATSSEAGDAGDSWWGFILLILLALGGGMGFGFGG